MTQKRIKELYDLHIHRDALNLSSNVSDNHFWTFFFFKVKLKLISCSTLLLMHAFTLLYIKCELS